MLLPERLDYLRDIDLSRVPVAPPPTRIGPCVGQVGKIICSGLNYSDHAAETGATRPSEPSIFLKATSAICGPYDELRLPRGAVIGTPGVYLSERNALGHAASYCVANDVSERAYQLERLGTWNTGKCCDTLRADRVLVGHSR